MGKWELNLVFTVEVMYFYDFFLVLLKIFVTIVVETTNPVRFLFFVIFFFSMKPQYSKLYKQAKETFNSLPGNEIQALVNREWRVVKGNPVKFESLLKEWKSNVERRFKRKRAIWGEFAGEIIKKKPRDDVHVKIEVNNQVEEKSVKIEKPNTPVRGIKIPAKTPKQDQLRARITICDTEIDALKTLLAGPFPTTEQRVKLKTAVKMRDKCLLELRRLQSMVLASRKQRKRRTKFLKSAGK